jgi:hypothetical protein
VVNTFEIISQVLVIIFVFHAAIYSYKIARWSCARSVQWLTAGFIYILVWRIAYSIIQRFDSVAATWVEDNQSFFILAAYVMWAWGLYLLYKTLINLGRKQK